VCTLMTLSKPRRGPFPTGWSRPGTDPASTRQEAASVAPFQLAYTVLTCPRCCTASAGCVRGWPSQENS
jgi:hypothetical protein